MPFYVDTSAFLKLVVDEDHSVPFRGWADANDGELFSSDLLFTEALHQARRHSPDAAREVRRRLEVLTILRVTREIFERAADLDPNILRALDAVHLAAALAVGEELEGIVTYDRRLGDAAALHGVAVVMPGLDDGAPR